MFVLWSFWFLCLGDLYLFFYPCKQESLIAPLHFFFLLLIRLCVCTIFFSVVSCNACIVSICTRLLDHVSVSILCLLLLSIWYYVVYSLFVVFTQPTFRVNPIFKNFWLVHSCWNTLVLFCHYETFCLSFQTELLSHWWVFALLSSVMSLFFFLLDIFPLNSIKWIFAVP